MVLGCALGPARSSGRYRSLPVSGSRSGPVARPAGKASPCPARMILNRPAHPRRCHWHLDLRPDQYGIAVGAFADPDFPPPTLSVWEQTKHSWINCRKACSAFRKRVFSHQSVGRGRPRHTSCAGASRPYRLGATVCFSRLELILRGSLALSPAADVVVLPLRTRR
jgi:hypothetical protein